MSSPWLYRLARLALALLLVVSTAALTVPATVAHTISESEPDEDDDRETELVAPTSARKSLQPARASGHTARHTQLGARLETRSSYPAGTHRITSIDPLGARLRC